MAVKKSEYIYTVIVYYDTYFMLEIEKLRFGYKKNKLLFSDLSLRLREGHVYGLLGKNGAGKSTLLKNITGLVRPLSGSCRYHNLEVSRRPVSVLQDLFFIPEDIYLPAISLSKFVTQTGAFYPRFDRTAFFDYLSLLDIQTEGSMASQSYGQQKKILIAFGLATNASLLIMDEPTNGLDIPSKIEFRKLIASVQSDTRSIVISTHQVRDLDNLIDTLLLLHDNRILIHQSMEEIGEKLMFGTYAETDGMSVIYQEQTLQGYRAIRNNTSGGFRNVDLELLFNAATSGNTLITELLKTQ